MQAWRVVTSIPGWLIGGGAAAAGWWFGSTVGEARARASECGEELSCWLSAMGAERYEAQLRGLGFSTVSELTAGREEVDESILGVPWWSQGALSAALEAHARSIPPELVSGGAGGAADALAEPWGSSAVLSACGWLALLLVLVVSFRPPNRALWSTVLLLSAKG
jgi:hypothetical protein